MCCVTGHDEDEDKAKMGTPLERMFLMAEAMLEAMKQFKSPDGKSLKIRVGQCSCPYNTPALLACRLETALTHIPYDQPDLMMLITVNDRDA